MSEQRQINDQDPSVVLAAKKMELESGWLGKFFGNRANAPSNVSGLVLIVLLLSGIVMIVLPYEDPNALSVTPKEYWDIIVPIVTLIFGYMFGRRSNGD